MASIIGGQHVLGGADGGHGAGAGVPGQLGAFSLSLITQPLSVGGGRDLLLGGAHNTISGAHSTGLDNVAASQDMSSGAGGGAGFDTVTGPEHGMPVAGENRPAADQVVASETHRDGDTTLHLHDGSSITLIGTTHIDSSLFH
jgi:hypothetical protein